MTDSSAAFQDEFLTQMCKNAWIHDKDNIAMIKQEMLPVLQERIMLQIYGRLTPEQNEKLTALFVNGTSEAIVQYMHTAIPNYDAFLAEIYLQFEDEYLSLMRQQ
jgi:hypothetical protein